MHKGKRNVEVEKAYRKKIKEMGEKTKTYDFSDLKVIKKFKFFTIYEVNYPYEYVEDKKAGFIKKVEKHHILVQNNEGKIRILVLFFMYPFNRFSIGIMDKYIEKNYNLGFFNTKENKSIAREHMHLIKFNK